MLNNEINFKLKDVSNLSADIYLLRGELRETMSYIDFLGYSRLILANLKSYVARVRDIHNRKLFKLNISRPSSLDPSRVVHNYSNYELSHRELFILSLGLNFALPKFDWNKINYYFYFERLTSKLKDLNINGDFNQFRSSLSFLASNYFVKFRNLKYSSILFTKSDSQILNNLRKNDKIVISRPNKGNGVVILNKESYLDKMQNILNDQTKFNVCRESFYKLTFKLEDKVNRFLKLLKEKNIIDQNEFSSLYVTGSGLGSMYVWQLFSS